MAFNSFEFIFLFLPITCVLYFFAGSKKKFIAALILIIAGIIFYASWNWRYLPLLLASVFINYFLGVKLEKSPAKNTKKKFLLAGLFLNFSVLAYYKIINFLPLGISFWTFVQVGYLVEIYRANIKSFPILKYFSDILFFPSITSGPILNFNSRGGVTESKNIYDNLAYGLTLFFLGLFKKVYIADTLAPIANNLFSNSSSLSFFEAWAAALSYSGQLYFDFSGYSDMAVALGLMFNRNLPLNFDSPYKSLSVIDFWRRWHISLGTWIKNYIYIPLGGSREGELKKIRNVIAAMLFTGIWHGLGWTFITWGALHGLMLAVNHQWRRLDIKIPKIFAWLITFIFILISWVIFRANNLNDAFRIITSMFNFQKFYIPTKFFVNFNFSKIYLDTISIFCATFITLLCPNTQEIMKKFKPNFLWVLIIFVLSVISFINFSGVSDFLYFNF